MLNKSYSRSIYANPSRGKHDARGRALPVGDAPRVRVDKALLAATRVVLAQKQRRSTTGATRGEKGAWCAPFPKKNPSSTPFRADTQGHREAAQGDQRAHAAALGLLGLSILVHHEGVGAGGLIHTRPNEEMCKL